MPPATNAQRKATDKYIKEKTDELKIRVPKGDKERIQTHAKVKDGSLNAFVNRAINEAMDRDKG